MVSRCRLQLAVVAISLVLSSCGDRRLGTTISIPGVDARVSIDDPAARWSRFETSPVVSCSPDGDVDFRHLPSCVRLFSELANCCAHVIAVKSYLFHITLRACVELNEHGNFYLPPDTLFPADPKNEETCRKLLTAGELRRQCDYLRAQAMCTSGELLACGTSGHGCSQTYFCSTRRLLKCEKKGPSGTHLCVCSTREENSTFESPDICDYRGIPALGFLANVGCGWRVSMWYRAPREGEPQP